MSTNKKKILIFILLLLGVFMSEYEMIDSKKSELSSSTILYLDENLFNMFHKKYETAKDTGIYWGFEPEALEKKKKDINTTKSKLLKVNKKEMQNILCIEDTCYRLLGIYKEQNVSKISVYNQDLKAKIATYKSNDTLQESLVVKTIKHNSVVFQDKDSNRTWQFKLFDVNQSMYKPKEILDENNQSI